MSKASGKSVQRATGFPLFAALLIVAGILLLLQNFDILPTGMWRAVVKFWPVALLIIGVHIFLRDRPWLAGFVMLIIMLAAAGAAWWWAAHDSLRFVMALA